jgi:DNA end-binding protein Ku
VVIDDSDLENLPLPTAHAIEIEEFVPGDGIQGGLFFKSAYYVEPDDMGRKPYLLLQQALQETEMLAVAKIAFRDREHLCAVQPNNGHLLLNTLHWPDEIRSTERFEPERFQDDYQQALQRVIDAKAHGGEVAEAPEEEPEGKVMDLMEALKASVDAARKQRAKEPKEAAPSGRRQSRRKAS